MWTFEMFFDYGLSLERAYSQYSLCFSMPVSSLVRQLAKTFFKKILGMACVAP
jgi:hypothetical protein